MYSELMKIKRVYCTARLAKFNLYDGKTISFAPATFDKIFQINTIYFREDPIALVYLLVQLIINGLLVLTLRGKKFYEIIIFVVFYESNLYELINISAILPKHPFSFLHISKRDMAMDKSSF